MKGEMVLASWRCSYTIYSGFPGERPEVRALISQMTCGSPDPEVRKAEAEVYPVLGRLTGIVRTDQVLTSSI